MSEDSFLERLLVLWVGQLLGPKAVEDFLLRRDETSFSNDSLYWRSNFLYKDPLQEPWPTEHRLVFLDITCKTSIDDTDGSSILMQLGGFFLKGANGYYVQTRPITFNDVKEHTLSVGIEIESAYENPNAVSGMMVQAILNEETNGDTTSVMKASLVFEEGTTTPSTIVLSLYYNELGETGTISLPIQKSSMGFDHLGVTLLFRNMSLPQAAPTSEDDDTNGKPLQAQDVEDLKSSLQTWTQWKNKLLEDKRHAAAKRAEAKSLSAKKETKKDDSAPVATLSSKEKKVAAAQKPIKRPGNYASVSKKKIKKKGLTFAKSSK